MLDISQDRAQVTFWYQKWGLNFYISQAKLSTVGKRDGGFEAQVGRLEAAVGGRPQAVGSSGGCRRQDARCPTREGAAALQWLDARSAVRSDRETGPRLCTRCSDRGDGGGAIFKGASGDSSRGCCFTEGADGKRGIATSNNTSTFEATRRVVAGDGTNTHAP